MINRNVAQKIRELSTQFPIVLVSGPRQSGKTTLVRSLFSEKTYMSLENPDDRQRAIQDPRLFLSQLKEGAILDEIQRVPELFSYLQQIVDEEKVMGQFILTGSQNFLMMKSVTQSLAGRIAIFKLLPFSMLELPPQKPINHVIFEGRYPALFDRNISASDYYPNYIETYIERDLRSLKEVKNLSQFQSFLGLCAGRSGQLLNIASLSNEAGISHDTAESWLSVLEASFITFRLKPYFKNFNKRLVKQSKLYFYDTGLLCYLLGIRNEHDIQFHPLRGQLFETLIISEFVKHRFNKGTHDIGYFWRDSNGNEVDYLLEQQGRIIPVEIKSTMTVKTSLFKGLQYWQKIHAESTKQGYLVAGVDKNQVWPEGSVLGWRYCHQIFDDG